MALYLLLPHVLQAGLARAGFDAGGGEFGGDRRAPLRVRAGQLADAEAQPVIEMQDASLGIERHRDPDLAAHHGVLAEAAGQGVEMAHAVQQRHKAPGNETPGPSRSNRQLGLGVCPSRGPWSLLISLISIFDVWTLVT